MTLHYFTSIRVKNVAKTSSFESGVVLSGLIVIFNTTKFHIDDPAITFGPSQVLLLRNMGLDLKRSNMFGVDSTPFIIHVLRKLRNCSNPTVLECYVSVRSELLGDSHFR